MDMMDVYAYTMMMVDGSVLGEPGEWLVGSEKTKDGREKTGGGPWF